MLAGLRFVFRTELILATITLDLFAVLIGGSVALLPIFARDILHVGPTGLGWLRAAPAAGAFLMALILPIDPRCGARDRPCSGRSPASARRRSSSPLDQPRSRSRCCSSPGALDNISVVVRATLVQVLSPDAMRGRVGAVNAIFIGSSNELGEFESGVTAGLFGAVRATILGGVGSILVVLAVAWGWPSVRRLGSLREMGDHS